MFLKKTKTSTKPENQRIISAALVTILILTIASCGIETSPVESSKSDYIVVGQGQYPRAETLIMVGRDAYSIPECFNPLFIAGWTEEGKGYRSLLYETFFQYNPYTGQYIPWLATGYEYANDFSYMDLFLRPGAKWSDGIEITSSDVVFTANLLQNNIEFIFASWVQQYILRVEAIDKYTARFVLKSPNRRIHLDLTSLEDFPEFEIVPEHIYSKVDVRTFMNAPPNTVGSGPYTPVETTVDTCVWKRRDDYWGIEVMGWVPQPKYIIATYPGAEDKVALAFQNNELDLGLLTYSVYAAAKAVNPLIQMWNRPGTNARCVLLNYARYPFNIPEVRWAFSYAYNRTRPVALGYGLIKTENLQWHPQYPLIQKYVKSSILAQHPFTYDPTKSIELLEDLGFTRGDDGIFVTPNGTRFSFEYLCLQVDPETNAMVEDLRKVGWEITPRAFSWGPYWSFMGTGQYDLCYYWASIPAMSSPYTWYRQFVTANWREVGVDIPEGRNRERYRNPEWDALIAEVSLLDDDSSRAIEIWDRLMEISLEDMMPSVPITWSLDLRVLNTKYWKNWPTSWNGTNAYGTPAPGVAHFLPVIFGIESVTLGKITVKDLMPTQPAINVTSIVDAINVVGDKVTNVKTTVDAMNTKVISLEGQVSGLSSILYVAVILSLVAVALSVVSLLRKRA